MNAKPALFATILLILASCSCLLIFAQAPTPTATLSLTVEPSVVKAATPLTLEAVLTNHSDKQMLFHLYSSCGFDLSLQINLRDGKGNQPPQTRRFRLAKGEDIGREPNGSVLVCGGDSGLRGVMPNDHLKTTVDLTRMYDLTEPGTYTVQVSIVDTNQNVFQSNPVEFTVVHNPDYTPDVPCKTSADVIVTVSDPSGAFISNALVVFRPEGSSKEHAQLQQVKTNSAGLTHARVACGFADVFIAADRLTPYAHKTYIGQAQVPLTVVLNPWPTNNPSQ